MHHFPSRDELQSSGKLVRDLQGLGLSYWSSTRYDVFQVAVGAKLEDHDDIMLGQETVVYLGGEKTIDVGVFGELFKNGHFPICVQEGILMMALILLPYCLMSFKGSMRTAITL